MASIISASTTSATALNLSGDTTGILQLATGATPTTAVTIDASQNVGIGTVSPAGKLDITKATNGNAFVVNALGGSTPNFIVQGVGEQTFRLYNSDVSPNSTRTSIKLASRLNTDWEWIAYTDAAGTGINDLSIVNQAGTALYINPSRSLFVGGTTQNTATAPVYSSTTAKAWVSFSGTTIVIQSSFNISSVTRASAGLYTVNMTTAMADTNYAVVCGGSIGTNGTNRWVGANPTSTTAFAVGMTDYSGANIDGLLKTAAVFR